MIAYILGTVIDRSENELIVMTKSGVGYAVRVTPDQLSTCAIGDTSEWYTYLRVSETAQELYGFATKEQKELFLLLVSVSGVGPKTAMNVLSVGSVDDVRAAIARGDAVYLAQAPGLGKKTAQRMIVDLKGKIGTVDTPQHATGSASQEVLDALVAMGYADTEAREAIARVKHPPESTEQYLKQVLIQLM
jgi:Holliday junction DNA helicase RuvA